MQLTQPRSECKLLAPPRNIRVGSNCFQVTNALAYFSIMHLTFKSAWAGQLKLISHVTCHIKLFSLVNDTQAHFLSCLTFVDKAGCQPLDIRVVLKLASITTRIKWWALTSRNLHCFFVDCQFKRLYSTGPC